MTPPECRYGSQDQEHTRMQQCNDNGHTSGNESIVGQEQGTIECQAGVQLIPNGLLVVGRRNSCEGTSGKAKGMSILLDAQE